MTGLVRWRRPSVGAHPFHSDVERLFDGFFSGSRSAYGARGHWVPAVDLTETEDALVLSADLPGLGPDDVEIEVKDGVLTISGERSEQRESEEGGYRRAERSYGRFSRALRLPRGTDPERIEASFDRGVLEVRVAKPEERKAHRVEIASASGEGSEPETVEGEGSEKS